MPIAHRIPSVRRCVNTPQCKTCCMAREHRSHWPASRRDIRPGRETCGAGRWDTVAAHQAERRKKRCAAPLGGCAQCQLGQPHVTLRKRRRAMTATAGRAGWWRRHHAQASQCGNLRSTVITLSDQSHLLGPARAQFCLSPLRLPIPPLGQRLLGWIISRGGAVIGCDSARCCSVAPFSSLPKQAR